MRRARETECGIVLMAVLCILSAGALDAQAIVLYTDEAAFIAAVGAHDLETFEGVAPGNYGTSATFGVHTFGSPPSSIMVVTDTGQFGAHNTTPGGRLFIDCTSSPSYHDPMDMSRVDAPMTAYGANFTDLDFGTINFLVDGVTLHSPSPGGDANTMFVGFIAGPGESFTTVRLEVNDNTYGIDDVRSRAGAPGIPEPGTLALLGLGLLGFVRKRRK